VTSAPPLPRVDIIGLIVAAGFLSCIFTANVFIAHIGVNHGPSQPHTIALGLGLSSPSGALLAGASFTLRDLVQHRLGLGSTVAVIAAGTALSAWVSPTLAFASGISFLASETADLTVYTPLRSRSAAAAVLASNTVGAAIDTTVFLCLAYGWTSVTRFGAGQVIVKLISSILVAGLMFAVAALLRSRHPFPSGLAGHRLDVNGRR
jgi:uncharacterized PurR-regulated membrane protein YhhQ (DUF165 family)